MIGVLEEQADRSPVSNADLRQAPQIDNIEILELAGRGAMSLVYKARQVLLDRVVAVKVLSKNLLSGESGLQRFFSEAKLSSRLDHPNIAGIIGFGMSSPGFRTPAPSDFYGGNRWGSGVEVPAQDQDFYALKDVPHGDLRQTLYHSKSVNANLRCFVYTPPGYEKDQSKRYPVLYLQHGGGRMKPAGAARVTPV